MHQHPPSRVLHAVSHLPAAAATTTAVAAVARGGRTLTEFAMQMLTHSTPTAMGRQLLACTSVVTSHLVL